MKSVRFILSNLWFWLRNPHFEVGHDPYMPSQEKEAFMQFAHRAKNILEYGGGGSTVWLNKIGKLGTCIENDKNWIGVIQKAAENSGYPENLNLLYAHTGLTGSYGMPVLGNFTRGLVKKGLIYVATPFVSVEPTKQYDLVFIDGRWRVSCCLYSALMLSREVPILLDDYAGNRRYEMLKEFFEIKLFGRLAHLTLKQNIDRSYLFYQFVESLKDAE